MVFQWRYHNLAKPRLSIPNILNVGCSDDPVHFGAEAVHYDIDRWPRFKWFSQGDAHRLPFKTGSFHTVIMGDIIEHLMEPRQAVLEAARVASRRVVMTIFEEWKLPGPGRWVKEGAHNGDVGSQDLGYADREAYQTENFPDRVGYPDDVHPHLVHIQQFTDEAIEELVSDVPGYGIREYLKEYEATSAGHDWFNWLVCLEVPK